MRAAGCCHRPSMRPAVAVEHRQRPKIASGRAEAERQRVTHGVKKSAAVMTDHALGCAGRAGSVVQADRLPLFRDLLDVERSGYSSVCQKVELARFLPFAGLRKAERSNPSGTRRFGRLFRTGWIAQQ